MYYPQLNELSSSRSMIDVFLGYNHNPRIQEGEFYDMKNLSSASYPLLAPRGKRGIYEYPSGGTHSPQGLIAKDALCYVDGDTLYINNNPVAGLTLSTSAEDCPKQLVSMGAYLIIMPDKKWINTKDLTKYGNIEASLQTATTVAFTLCKNDGTAYETPTVSDTAPVLTEEITEYPLWIDTSETPHSLKQYNQNTSMWVSIPSTYVKIAAPGIGIPFEVGDGIKVSGITVEAMSSLNANMIIQSKGDDYIVVIGVIDQAMEQSSENPITVSRQMPNMDYVVEANNRLWGCYYGVNSQGKVLNEIYASKLGDFKNWNVFAGTSTDSYAASCGTDGQFTGAITYLGYPMFFKENCFHKVYGNYPANFQIQATTCRGVQKGSEKSLAIANETLFYKSRNGICAYEGSLPTEISEVFGGIQYTDAVAGSNRDKYYVSMKDSEDVYHLFVFDTIKGMWHKEDNLRVDAFCSCDGEMYFIDHADNKIKTVLGSGTAESGGVLWSAESGIIGTETPDRKYISRLTVRMSLTRESSIDFFAEYDSSGKWEHLSSVKGSSLRTFSFPLRPKRCDHFRIKIYGSGEAKILSITKTIEQGSDGI